MKSKTLMFKFVENRQYFSLNWNFFLRLHHKEISPKIDNKTIVNVLNCDKKGNK